MTPRFLIVGLGGIGQRHLRNLRALVGTSAEIYAWRARGEHRVLNDQLGIAADDGLEEQYQVRAVPSLEDGLSVNPDAVLICNPSSLHLRVAQAAADAGCHLFIEKPLATSLDGVDRLIDTVRERDLTTLLGYQLRFHPLVQKLHALLEARALGPILAARMEVGEYLPAWHPYEDYRRMYASRHDLGGGVILSQIHELDLACWFFGPPRCVFAIAGHWTSLEVDVEDVASLLMECRADGRPLPVHVQQDYIQRPPARTIDIVGECGRATLDFHRLRLTVVGPDRAEPDITELVDFQRNTMFLEEMRHFLACIEGRETPLVPVDVGAASLRVALAARESARSGAVVEMA